ncbi:MAG: hypothetical protein MMC33_004686 [Icmadophila ericetorum]|nr:hypothetical protein [Icmadophila ericetorum]
MRRVRRQLIVRSRRLKEKENDEVESDDGKDSDDEEEGDDGDERTDDEDKGDNEENGYSPLNSKNPSMFDQHWQLPSLHNNEKWGAYGHRVRYKDGHLFLYLGSATSSHEKISFRTEATIMVQPQVSTLDSRNASKIITERNEYISGPQSEAWRDPLFQDDRWVVLLEIDESSDIATKVQTIMAETWLTSWIRGYVANHRLIRGTIKPDVDLDVD